jgi:hypothetical protein
MVFFHQNKNFIRALICDVGKAWNKFPAITHKIAVLLERKKQ